MLIMRNLIKLYFEPRIEVESRLSKTYRLGSLGFSSFVNDLRSVVNKLGSQEIQRRIQIILKH